MLQTEIVACALCEADGKNPDEAVPTGELEMIRVEPGVLVERPVTRKAWQGYEAEARRLVVAARAMEKFSSSLRLFGSLGRMDREAGRA